MQGKRSSIICRESTQSCKTRMFNRPLVTSQGSAEQNNPQFTNLSSFHGDGSLKAMDAIKSNVPQPHGLPGFGKSQLGKYPSSNITIEPVPKKVIPQKDVPDEPGNKIKVDTSGQDQRYVIVQEGTQRKRQALLDREGYRFTKDKIRNNKTYWRCELRKECGVGVKQITKGTEITFIPSTKQHTHQPNKHIKEDKGAADGSESVTTVENEKPEKETAKATQETVLQVPGPSEVQGHRIEQGHTEAQNKPSLCMDTSFNNEEGPAYNLSVAEQECSSTHALQGNADPWMGPPQNEIMLHCLEFFNKSTEQIHVPFDADDLFRDEDFPDTASPLTVTPAPEQAVTMVHTPASFGNLPDISSILTVTPAAEQRMTMAHTPASFGNLPDGLSTLTLTQAPEQTTSSKAVAKAATMTQTPASLKIKDTSICQEFTTSNQVGRGNEPQKRKSATETRPAKYQKTTHEETQGMPPSVIDLVSGGQPSPKMDVVADLTEGVEQLYPPRPNTTMTWRSTQRFQSVPENEAEAPGEIPIPISEPCEPAARYFTHPKKGNANAPANPGTKSTGNCQEDHLVHFPSPVMNNNYENVPQNESQAGQVKEVNQPENNNNIWQSLDDIDELCRKINEGRIG